MKKTDLSGLSSFRVFFEDASVYEDEGRFKEAYSELTDMRKLKVEACKKDEAKRLSLATGHLLVSVLRSYSIDPDKVRLGEYGKPYLSDHEIFFSLANKNTQAIMAVSESDIGCDLEFVNERKFSQPMVDRKYFAEEKALMDSMDKEARTEEFFRVWTKKEAYGKLLGTGIRDAVLLNTALIENGRFSAADREFKMSEYTHPVKNYIISVCQYI